MATVRPLTGGEVKLGQSIFGKHIDYTKVRIHHESFLPFGAQPDNVAMAPNGNIYFDPAGTLYQADFSKASSSLQALFIHEMTHVWQHQRGVNVLLKGVYQRQYSYLPLKPNKAFSKYGIEQQGDIVRDYFLIKIGRPPTAKHPRIGIYERLLPFAAERTKASKP